MCKARDIIIIYKYKHGKNELSKHSFVVIDDKNGEIQGIPYDIVCNAMSSFKNEKQKEQKLKFSGNFPISHNDTKTNPDDGKDGYIKSEQFYYFDKNKLNYKVIGSMNEDSFDLLIDYIENLEVPIENIIDNL